MVARNGVAFAQSEAAKKFAIRWAVSGSFFGRGRRFRRLGVQPVCGDVGLTGERCRPGAVGRPSAGLSVWIRNDDGGEGAGVRPTFTAPQSGTHYTAAHSHGDDTGTWAARVRAGQAG